MSEIGNITPDANKNAALMEQMVQAQVESQRKQNENAAMTIAMTKKKSEQGLSNMMIKEVTESVSDMLKTLKKNGEQIRQTG